MVVFYSDLLFGGPPNSKEALAEFCHSECSEESLTQEPLSISTQQPDESE